MCSRTVADVMQNVLGRPTLTIGPVGEKGIPHVDNGENARRERDLFAFETQRIAAAIPFFVMRVGNIECGPQVFDGRKQFERVNRMFFHYDPFRVGKRAGFEQNRVGDAHFADISRSANQAAAFKGCLTCG